MPTYRIERKTNPSTMIEADRFHVTENGILWLNRDGITIACFQAESWIAIIDTKELNKELTATEQRAKDVMNKYVEATRATVD